MAMPGDSDSDVSSLGLGISDLTPRPSMEGYNAVRSEPPARDPTTPTATLATTPGPRRPTADSSPSISYSTTDDEDALHMPRPNGPHPFPRPANPSFSLSSSSDSLLRPERASLSSGSESYYPSRPPPHPTTTSAASTLPSAVQRRRIAATTTTTTNATSTSTSPTPHTASATTSSSINTRPRARSPLALTSLAASPLPPAAQPDPDWDYAETAWWGWLILAATWAVFVVGMGSCLGVWSWAWDVGTTPYAPPELEDDPTLPIVGYYPALTILTGVMAWVWVVVAWVGMKYFRHAQVSGD
ncbi:741c77cb-e981-4cd9-89dc-a1c87d43fe7f [Thermothielavioides terrestris]|uniref:Uncharacterized protein n=2 Tax=Thermothielavioides terrestris TaxID=2587410 RepID=G2QS12_THETT|nr:uncharacterized protein THITE_2106958 [Thermothielavioides terrestris NRRL 8126]AEO62599.1 hypothetical protein THITE_2106958 [Thermothielavioides terrestris NRRL 8126]SPQ21904.1 741c77cb-e981-4cd9-89dc-a1c87d43fe7f [Thermothielavioides terrestris]